MAENTGTLRSGENDDLLVRSMKTIKAMDVSGSLEQDVAMVEPGKSRLSFKEMVMGGPLDENDGLIIVSMVDEWPSNTISEKLRDHIQKPWANCLIIKLLGRSIGFKLLDEKIRKLWNPKADYELIDLGDGFFLVRFTSLDDMHFAMDKGPWIIFGHYLTIRRYEPKFRPSTVTIDPTAVWVHFPGLPIEYYDEIILLSMGNTIGRAIKMDPNTRYASRGKFALVYMEVNLNKPLVLKINLDGHWQNVEYDGLNMIFVTCGCMGHKGSCPFEKAEELVDGGNSATEGAVNKERVHGKEIQRHVEDFGPWMIAQSRRQRKTTKVNLVSQWNVTITDAANLGSRFNVLTDLQEVDVDLGGKNQITNSRVEHVVLGSTYPKHVQKRDRPRVESVNYDLDHTGVDENNSSLHTPTYKQELHPQNLDSTMVVRNDRMVEDIVSPEGPKSEQRVDVISTDHRDSYPLDNQYISSMVPEK
ncbi:hypothetical protein REPUB_Repub12eG0038500 [Reevesia pubescens]